MTMFLGGSGVANGGEWQGTSRQAEATDGQWNGRLSGLSLHGGLGMGTRSRSHKAVCSPTVSYMTSHAPSNTVIGVAMRCELFMHARTCCRYKSVNLSVMLRTFSVHHLIHMHVACPQQVGLIRVTRALVLSLTCVARSVRPHSNRC